MAPAGLTISFETKIPVMAENEISLEILQILNFSNGIWFEFEQNKIRWFQPENAVYIDSL